MSTGKELGPLHLGRQLAQRPWWVAGSSGPAPLRNPLSTESTRLPSILKARVMVMDPERAFAVVLTRPRDSAL